MENFLYHMMITSFTFVGLAIVFGGFVFLGEKLCKLFGLSEEKVVNFLYGTEEEED